MELADVVDSKSSGSDIVPVRIRPAAPYILEKKLCYLIYLVIWFFLFSVFFLSSLLFCEITFYHLNNLPLHSLMQFSYYSQDKHKYLLLLRNHYNQATLEFLSSSHHLIITNLHNYVLNREILFLTNYFQKTQFENVE